MSPIAAASKKRNELAETEIPLVARAALWCRVCGGEGSVLVDPKACTAIKEDECRPYSPAPCPACHGERAVFVDVRTLREVRAWKP